jgi:hypothetical protein
MSNNYTSNEMEWVLKLINPMEKDYLNLEDAKLIQETAYLGLRRVKP